MPVRSAVGENLSLKSLALKYWWAHLIELAPSSKQRLSTLSILTYGSIFLTYLMRLTAQYSAALSTVASRSLISSLWRRFDPASLEELSKHPWNILLLFWFLSVALVYTCACRESIIILSYLCPILWFAGSKCTSTTPFASLYQRIFWFFSSLWLWNFVR